MCTLVFGLDVFGSGSVVIATNRDEDPARPSEGPQVLRRTPRVAGGRDARAGGTWLAVRAAGAGAPPGVALLLNRFDPAPGVARRSRGLLTLEVAAASDPRAAAERAAASEPWAPCSLVWLSPAGSWLLAIRPDAPPAFEPVPAGWHALAHHELDDPGDPRTAWLASELRAFPGLDRPAAELRLAALLATHAGNSVPAVCIHEGRAPTVSAARLWLSNDSMLWQHAAGPPCVTPFTDFTHLVAGADPAVEDS